MIRDHSVTYVTSWSRISIIYIGLSRYCIWKSIYNLKPVTYRTTWVLCLSKDYVNKHRCASPTTNDINISLYYKIFINEDLSIAFVYIYDLYYNTNNEKDISLDVVHYHFILIDNIIQYNAYLPWQSKLFWVLFFIITYSCCAVEICGFVASALHPGGTM